MRVRMAGRRPMMIASTKRGGISKEVRVFVLCFGKGGELSEVLDVGGDYLVFETLASEDENRRTWNRGEFIFEK
jgi:hypothetical protein